MHCVLREQPIKLYPTVMIIVVPKVLIKLQWLNINFRIVLETAEMCVLFMCSNVNYSMCMYFALGGHSFK